MADTDKRLEGESGSEESNSTEQEQEQASSERDSVPSSDAPDSDVESDAPDAPDSDVESDAPDSEVASESASRPENGGVPATPVAKSAGHDHRHGNGHAAHDEHGLSHVTPMSLLIGVFLALVVLTIVTVAVTKVDLGGEGNFIVAMVIATIKAGLVMAFFMHMRWDNKFNVVVFLGSFLFVLLFLSISLTDRQEYQDFIDTHEQAKAQP